MSEENLEIMLSYLRKHSGRYSLETLRGQLLAAGHSLEAANRAIGEFRKQSPPPEPPAWRLILLVAVLDLALLGVGFLLSISSLELPDLAMGVLSLSLPVLYFSQLFAGAVMLDSSVRRYLGRGLLFGGLLFLGVTILAVGGFFLVMLVSY